MKKQWICLGISVLLFGCSKSVVKEGTGSFTNKNGEVTTADVKLKDGKITEVKLDETSQGKDKTKKELGDNYNMKQASPIKKEWYEQVNFFETYVAKHGTENIKMNVDGKAENSDVLSGCTISIDGFLKAIDNAKNSAK